MRLKAEMMRWVEVVLSKRNAIMVYIGPLPQNLKLIRLVVLNHQENLLFKSTSNESIIMLKLSDPKIKWLPKHIQGEKGK